MPQMRQMCYALAVLVAATGAAAQDEPMTMGRVFEIAGARSAAAASGVISARVTEYVCLQPANNASEVYDRTLASLMSALDAVPAGTPPDPALAAPDKSEWAIETWYETEYAYDKGRYRLSRVTPSGSYHTAFDGVAQFRVDERTLYIESTEQPRQPMEDIKINLMRWDQIPAENYVRNDQESELKFLGGNRYNVWLRDKKDGGTVDQIFNVETGMVERGSMRNAAGQLLQDYVWLRPYLSNGVWVPSAYVQMEQHGDSVHLKVTTYKKWEVRPVSDEEFSIQRDAYDSVEGTAFPPRGVGKEPARTAKKSGLPQLQSQRQVSLPLNEPGIDMVELTKPPTESYVMRTVGLSLIVIALGLVVLYFVRWRAKWSEAWRTGFGLRGKNKS